MKKKALLSIIGILVLAAILIAVNFESVALKLVNWDKLYDLYGFATEEEIAEMIPQLAHYGENEEITSSYDESLAIRCSNGVFVGEKEGTVKTWKGIPYAKQPVGDLRWKAPEPAEDSARVWQAVYFGHAALQGPYVEETASLYPQGEDCLNLNIYESETGEGELRPVMVFIHGGAYMSGGSADPYYDCAHLAADNPDVIYVTINYRIGVFGFANFENVKGGENYGGSDNLGLLDQIEALKWVKKNAASFGGDGNNVTVFGESAGAGSIMALVASDLADGLFRHAIIESGNAYTFVRTKEESQNYTRILMKSAGAKNMDDLLNLPAEAIEQADMRTYMYTTSYTFPVCDGAVLPDNILDVLSAGKGKDIDILTGTNRDEMYYWIWEAGGEDAFLEIYEKRYQEEIKKMGSEIKELLSEVSAERGKTGPVQEICLYYDFMKFHTPAREEAKAHARSGGNSYMYYFTEESTDPDIGSFHGFELRYVFDHPEDHTYSDADGDPDLCRFIQRAWVNFAKTGNPTIPAGEIGNDEPIIWDTYSEESENVMLLNSEGCEMVTDPLAQLSGRIEAAD